MVQRSRRCPATHRMMATGPGPTCTHIQAVAKEWGIRGVRSLARLVRWSDSLHADRGPGAERERARDGTGNNHNTNTKKKKKPQPKKQRPPSGPFHPPGGRDRIVPPPPLARHARPTPRYHSGHPAMRGHLWGRSHRGLGARWTPAETGRTVGHPPPPVHPPLRCRRPHHPRRIASSTTAPRHPPAPVVRPVRKTPRRSPRR